MALVQIARFADLIEAQIAASALRAAGIAVHLDGEQHASVVPLLQTALGGTGLWVPAGDVEVASAFLDPHREGDADSLDWRHHPEAVRSIPFAAAGVLAGPETFGWAAAKLRRRVTLSAVILLFVGLAIPVLLIGPIIARKLGLS